MVVGSDLPAEVAQEIADRLIDAGGSGILNMAYTHLKVPGSISVVDVRILARFQELAYALRMKKETAGNGIEPDPVKHRSKRR